MLLHIKSLLNNNGVVYFVIEWAPIVLMVIAIVIHIRNRDEMKNLKF